VSAGERAPESLPALSLRGVDITYRVRGRDLRVVRDVSFAVARGESYGLVGESGCGKSTVALAIVRYLASNGRVSAGQILVDGRDVLALRGGALRGYRARTVSMVYQEPGRALNPTIRVGRQVAEVFELAGVPRHQARERAQEMLGRVRIADPEQVMARYPHQLSGGMLQRCVIAMALAAQPSLLVLDEPTTALDATVEAEVLDLIADLRQQLSTSLLFISHNLGVIARMCDRVGVLYAGELVEEGPAQEVFRSPTHPYTVGLLRCIPRRDAAKTRRLLDPIPGFLPDPGEQRQGCVFAPRCAIVQERCRTEPPPAYDSGPQRRARCHYHERAPSLPRSETAEPQAQVPDGAPQEPLLTISGVSKTYRQGVHQVHALAGVDLQLGAGETLGLVGESGSGKTTLARVVLGLTGPDAGGSVMIGGEPVAALARGRSPSQLKAVQIVFQNPDAALNRRHTVARLISRPLSKLGGYRGEALTRRLSELVADVRLSERHLPMRPVRLSGGLKQRVAIARAFAGDPKLVVCDEPTSALDVSVQAAILNLLCGLQQRERVSYLFISHDLGVVRYISDRIAVMYLGRLMEVGPAERVFSGPHHPYTEALLSAVPSLDGVRRERIRLEGEIPSAANPPSGCPFHTRCHRKIGEVCEQTVPPLAEAEPGHLIACHLPLAELGREPEAVPAGEHAQS
jgi:peptide/nickel transport system ATP-binding protein